MRAINHDRGEQGKNKRVASHGTTQPRIIAKPAPLIRGSTRVAAGARTNQ